VRYQVTPDPMRQVMQATLPKRAVDRIIAKRLGLLPPGGEASRGRPAAPGRRSAVSKQGLPVA
jgi:hypothetical protein